MFSIVHNSSKRSPLVETWTWTILYQCNKIYRPLERKLRKICIWDVWEERLISRTCFDTYSTYQVSRPNSRNIRCEALDTPYNALTKNIFQVKKNAVSKVFSRPKAKQVLLLSHRSSSSLPFLFVKMLIELCFYS